MHPSRFKIHSISARLKLIILSICGLVLLLSSIAATIYDLYRSRQDLEHKAQTMTEIVANQSAAAMLFHDAAAATENLTALRAAPEVMAALLVMPDDEPLGIYRRSQEVDPLSCIHYDVDGIHWLHGHLLSVKTILVGDQEAGRLIIQVGLDELDQERNTYIFLSLTLLTFAMGVASLLAVWLQRSITRPVEVLSSGIKQISRTGDYSVRVEKTTDDEMGHLTDGFNQMLSQIEQQEAALEQHQEELESLVEKRTEELRESVARANRLAFFDDLTGLANRMLFYERVDLTLAHARQNKDHFAVLFLDLDRFKRINDTFGHHIGDLLLKEVSSRLLTCIRKSDRIALQQEEVLEHCISRQGGDEFTLLLSELKSPEDAARVARRIIEAISQPIQLEGYEMVTTTSIGIAVYPEDGDTVDQLLKNADAAMYHAKMEGRNNYQFFRDAMHESSIRRLELETELRQAIEQKQFKIFFQPLVDLEVGKIYGAEALIRWFHPRLGAISPAEFIPVAEECDLIGDITEQVLDQTGHWLAKWRSNSLPPLRVSVNVSGARFGQQRLVEMIRQTIQEYGLSPRQLVLELTENWLMENRQETQEVLTELQREGVGIAIDDFGTGYSSLSYLKTFPIHTLKIDKSFIDDVTHDPNDAAIARAIIAMAHSLDLEVVAEGVETSEQRDLLYSLGCYRVQGYLFSRPLPAEEFETLLRTEGVRHLAS